MPSSQSLIIILETLEVSTISLDFQRLLLAAAGHSGAFLCRNRNAQNQSEQSDDCDDDPRHTRREEVLDAFHFIQIDSARANRPELSQHVSLCRTGGAGVVLR
eukprot:121938_1